MFADAALQGNPLDPNPANNVASMQTTVLPNDCFGMDATTLVTIGVGATCTATFESVGYLLTVSTTGRGSGTVTDDLGGLDCGLDCQEFTRPVR